MKDPLRYKYQTLEIHNREIHVRSLRDILDFHNEDSSEVDEDICGSDLPLFGVLWPSSFVLAQVMATKEIKNLKILEIGCGLALSSLVLSLRGANIKATDNHPSTKTFLDENIRINQCAPIPFIQADWEDIKKKSVSEKYDLIIGSDVLYLPEHLRSLSLFINLHCKTKCEVIIVDPNRGNQNIFKKEMKGLDFTHSKDDRSFNDEFGSKFKGHVHYYNRN
jgi:predicted nicotinamide N-methyase